MFGRNHFVNPPKRVGEFLGERHATRYLTENFADDNGDSATRVVAKDIDLSQPQTPQSGIETRLYDLSYCLRSSLPIPEGKAQLHLLGGGNPLSDFRITQSVLRNTEENINNSKSKENEAK